MIHNHSIYITLVLPVYAIYNWEMFASPGDTLFNIYPEIDHIRTIKK